MAEREDCIADILKAIRDRKDRKYVNDRLDELDSRADAASDGSPRERYYRAAREMLAEQAEQSAERRRTIRLQALAFSDLRSLVDVGAAAKHGSYPLAIEGAAVGVNPSFFDPKSARGNQLSAAAISKGAQKEWIGGAELDMIRAGRENPKFAGIERDFLDPRGSFNWFIEKIELEHQAKGFAARPGRTKDERALKIAEILQTWDKQKVGMQNEVGAWIGEHSAFGAPVSHDPDKMMSAAGNLAARMWASVAKNKPEQGRLFEEARQAWAAKTLQRIDARAMFGTAVDADKKLAEMFGGLVAGDHGEMVTVGTEPIFQNLAQSVSVHRAFVWKSAEDQLAHMKEFGRFNPTDAWLHSMKRGADAYGLMKVFGPKPKENFEEIIAYAKNKTMGTAERREINKAAPDLDKNGGGWLRNRYAVLSGEADRPIENVWSSVVAGVMGVQRWSKLGLTPFAMLQDNATISRELAYQGLGPLERNSKLLSGYFQGAEGSGKREIAELLHVGLRAQTRGITARWDVSDARTGFIAAVDNAFFGWTGIRAMTENKRSSAMEMMAWNFGRQRDKAWGALDRPESRIMEAFGVGEREWELLRKAEWNTIEGETYLTPDITRKIPDADVQAYLDAGRSIAQRAQATAPMTPEAKAAASAAALDRVRGDLAMKLWSYFSERGDFAVIEVGARERAMLYQGTQAGSTLNNALRLLLQFKQFPTAMLSKVWGRELYGGETGLGRITGLTELIVASTVYGMAANYLNQIVKGQDPNSQYRNSPGGALVAGFLRGGGASIYGDFLLGEWSRHGQQALETLAGPSVGQINQVLEIWADLTHMKKGAASASLAARMARSNTPFANMVYTKWAADYLLYYRFMEWLNPGYLERMERTMKDKQGIEFWLRPTQVAR